MHFDNNASRIRRDLLTRVARVFLSGAPGENVDRIPLEMRPKSMAASRCCIYRDRAVLKYRCMAALGLSPEMEADELIPLSAYAETALSRSRPPEPGLSVIDIACSACVQARYEVTSACRGCLAQSCRLSCPKGAITMENGRARIDTQACVGCGKCADVCPYHAIVRIPVPCEDACPVGAISKDENGREHIDPEACVECGRCVQACPFGAVVERSGMVDVLKALKSGAAPVVVLLAPAVAGQFPGTPEQTAAALKELGVSACFEVAEGAAETADAEARELEDVRAGGGFLATSCCPAWVATAERHVPEMQPHVSKTPTPMAYTAQRVRRETPDAVTVFIGPCFAKRREAARESSVDHVLTFEELGALFIAAGIDVAECSAEEGTPPATQAARRFPVSGGVAAAVTEKIPEARTEVINGLDRRTLKAMKRWPSRPPADLVEVMACPGGCVGGPGCVAPPRRTSRAVEKRAAAGGANKAAGGANKAVGGANKASDGAKKATGEAGKAAE